MINQPTVFILGAGASIPYNYPSGKSLVEEIITGLSRPRSELYKLCIELEFQDQEITKFAEALYFSGDDSIDAFLERERNKEFIDLGKVLITLCLIQREHTKTLFSNPPDSWYGDLVNELKSPVIENFKNEVSILTFNYDRSFDHYLYTAIKNSYGLSEKECTSIVKRIPIIHLHGQIGKLPWQEK